MEKAEFKANVVEVGNLLVCAMVAMATGVSTEAVARPLLGVALAFLAAMTVAAVATVAVFAFLHHATLRLRLRLWAEADPGRGDKAARR